MMTNVVDCPFDELEVGMALTVKFQPISDEFTIPGLRPGLREDTHMSDAVIVAAIRTPIGRAGRGLAGLSLQDIGAQTVAAAIATAGLDANDIDDLLIGEVLQGGGCTARFIANDLGLPTDTPGGAVQRQCATGMMAVQDAAAQIRSGMAQVIVAGGIESMTRSPALFAKAPVPFGVMQQFIPPSHPDTPDAPNMNMLITVGENTARECGITREESDHWSYHSNLRAAAAADDGRFASEIVPVTVPVGRGETATLSVDEHPRRDTTLEKLAALPSLTGPDGQVTAGNSSGIADGGAAVVVVDRDYAEAHGLEVLATIRSWNSCGIEPARTGLAPTICRSQSAAAGRPRCLRRRPGRDQRGLRHHVGGLCPQARLLPRHRQRERRRRGDRPPRGRFGHPYPGHPHSRAPPSGRRHRRGHPLCGRRHGIGHRARGQRPVRRSRPDSARLESTRAASVP